MPKAKMKLFILLIIFGVLPVTLISKWKHIFGHTADYSTGNLSEGTQSSISNSLDTHNTPMSMRSIIPIKNSSHFAVSAFIDHRLNKAIRVISIIKRNSMQPLYCLYCNNGQACEFTKATIEIHTDHFGFKFGASDGRRKKEF